MPLVVHPPPPAYFVALPMRQARKIAFRFAQDWADLLDDHARVGACERETLKKVHCRVTYVGPTKCSMRLIVWRTDEHTYYARARDVICK